MEAIEQVMAARDDVYREQLERIGREIGYGRAQQILVERLRDDAQGEDLGADGMGWSPDPALKREAADELVRLHGQMETLGRWIVEALKVLDTIDPDDMEESEQLLTLIKGGEMLSMSALAPQMWARARKAAGKGPTCNVLRPWEQVE